MRKERDNALARAMTAEDKEFVEMVDQEYYKRVKTSEEFYTRKKLILQNLDKLQAKVQAQAENYDDYAKLKFIVLQKAQQKSSILKNFIKLENYQNSGKKFDTNFGFNEEDSENFNTQADGDEFEYLYGVENEFSKDIKEKI